MNRANPSWQNSGAALPNKVIVTGGCSGIGLAVAEVLAGAGKRVCVLDVDREACDRVTSMAADGVSVLQVDVSDGERLSAAVASAGDMMGGLDGLVVAAGVRQPHALLGDLTFDSWNKVLSVNTTGAFFTITSGVKLMRKLNQGGRIVTVASIGAGVPRFGSAAYCASKAALVQLTRVAALELAAAGIRVNAVLPGLTDSGMLTAATLDQSKDIISARVTGDPSRHRPGIPMRRIATTAEQANVICFLLSSFASHVTGQSVYVDGGESMV